MVKLIYIEEKGLRMRLKNRRSELVIIYDLLSLLEKQELKKTHLMYKTNLSYTHFVKYLKYLLKKEFIAERETGNPIGKVYYITNQGKKFIKEFKNVLDLL